MFSRKPTKRWLNQTVLAALSLLVLFSGVYAPTASAQQLQLTGAGASFPYPIYSKWFDEYYKLTGIQINYQSIGSGGGVRQTLARTVDFGASDAPMTDEELAQAQRPIVHIPTVIGAVSVVYNIPGIRQTGVKLTPDVLAEIFLGEITRWNDARIQQLNPELRPAQSGYRGGPSSRRQRHHLHVQRLLEHRVRKWETPWAAGRSLNWPTGLGARGNEGVAGLVRQLPGAIGYVEQAYAEQNNLAQAALRNKDGYFVHAVVGRRELDRRRRGDARRTTGCPSSTVAGPDAYPIATFTWLLVYEDAFDYETGKALADFLWWAIHDGQKFAPELDYAPLPDAVVKRLEETLLGLTYNGRPLLSR